MPLKMPIACVWTWMDEESAKGAGIRARQWGGSRGRGGRSGIIGCNRNDTKGIVGIVTSWGVSRVESS